MKLLLLTISSLLLSFLTVSDDVTDRIGVKGPLEFNGVKYNLAWSDRPRDNYYIQEYLPEGQKPENFNEMMTIHLFVTGMSVNEAVQQKGKELTSRKNTDPLCNYQITESPDGKEYMVDFLLSESKGDDMSIAEFNVYRYKQADPGNDQKGFLVYAYSKRSYGDDITPFLKNLKDEKINYLNEMSLTNIPEVTIKDQE
ncbi:MAG TPA: hypothetical protein PKC91_13180 [Ignavibacteria bacterium]|nr:hypothetical protein [Ignavibacteria bacterium]